MILNHKNIKEYPGVNENKIISSNTNQYGLYAFTENEMQFHIFRKLRDMSQFRVVVKKLSKGEYEKIRNDDYYCEFYLSNRILLYKVISKDKEFTSSYISVSVTDRELKYVMKMSDDIFASIISDYDYILFNFNLKEKIKSEYYKSLDKIYDFGDIISKPYDESDDGIPWFPKKYNHFTLYCNIFKNTYKKKMR